MNIGQARLGCGLILVAAAFPRCPLIRTRLNFRDQAALRPPTDVPLRLNLVCGGVPGACLALLPTLRRRRRLR
jgi:hypothetical protein